MSILEMLAAYSGNSHPMISAWRPWARDARGDSIPKLALCLGTSPQKYFHS